MNSLYLQDQNQHGFSSFSFTWLKDNGFIYKLQISYCLYYQRKQFSLYSLPVCETLLFLLLLSSSKICIQIYNPREVLSGSNLFLQSFVDNIIIHEKSMAEVFKGVCGHASKLIKIWWDLATSENLGH